MSLNAQTILAVQEGKGQMTIFRPGDGQTTVIPLGEKPHEIELSPDGKTAYVTNFGLLEANTKIGTPGTTISVIDIAGRRERTRFHLPEGPAKAPHGLKLRPPKYNELFTNAEMGGDTMIVFDARSGQVRRQFPLPPGVHNFVFAADGSALLAFTLGGEVVRIHPESGAIEARVAAPNTRGIAWTADGKQLLVAGRGELAFLHPRTLAVERKIGGLPIGQIFYPAASPDGRWILAPGVLSGKVLVLDAKTGTVYRVLETGSPLLLVFGKGGKEAWISNVLVPEGFQSPETKGKPGSVTRLSLLDWTLKDYPAIPDANGLAVVGN